MLFVKYMCLMKQITLLFLLSVSSLVSATTYYVSPGGQDNNSGTISQPWATWGKAFSSRSSGDTVYFRGGIYFSTVKNGLAYSATINGTANKTICFLNYPGETPILDCSTVTSTTYNHNYGLTTSGSYFKIKGLTVRNVWQYSPTDEADAWVISGNNIIIENCTAYNSNGVGYEICGREVYVINCDSYNHCDSLTTELPGNDG